MKLTQVHDWPHMDSNFAAHADRKSNFFLSFLFTMFVHIGTRACVYLCL